MPGRPCGAVAQQLYPARFQAEPARSHNAADHDEQPHGFVLEENLPEHEHRQGEASHGQRGGIGFTQVPEKVTAVEPEITVLAVMPNNLGNCVLARNRAIPHLNPTITLSEMKLTIEPALAAQAANPMSATSKAVPAASAEAVGSPFTFCPARRDEQEWRR